MTPSKMFMYKYGIANELYNLLTPLKKTHKDLYIPAYFKHYHNRINELLTKYDEYAKKYIDSTVRDGRNYAETKINFYLASMFENYTISLMSYPKQMNTILYERFVNTARRNLNILHEDPEVLKKVYNDMKKENESLKMKNFISELKELESLIEWLANLRADVDPLITPEAKWRKIIRTYFFGIKLNGIIAKHASDEEFGTAQKRFYRVPDLLYYTDYKIGDRIYYFIIPVEVIISFDNGKYAMRLENGEAKIDYINKPVTLMYIVNPPKGIAWKTNPDNILNIIKQYFDIKFTTLTPDDLSKKSHFFVNSVTKEYDSGKKQFHIFDFSQGKPFLNAKPTQNTLQQVANDMKFMIKLTAKKSILKEDLKEIKDQL